MDRSCIDKATAAWLERTRADMVFSAEARGHTLTYHTTWGLFSPRGLDEGSRLLLDHLEVRPNDDTIDLGCGYGPLGLTLARLAPEGTSVLVDKDFVAVGYSRHNARLNGIHNVDIFLSNGFGQVGEREFDLVVSNLPAKTGKELYYLYFYDALLRMRPGARCYVVTITGLRKFVQKAFNEVFGNYEKIKQGRTYTVARAIKQG
ncbi:MAG: methyltransferase [gamma proteobacterium symbiont of Phacoides pectinatus]